MIFTAGVILFVIGKFILAMHISNLAFGYVSTGEKIGVVLAAAGSIMILLSGLILAWSYLP